MLGSVSFKIVEESLQYELDDYQECHCKFGARLQDVSIKLYSMSQLLSKFLNGFDSVSG